MADEPVFTLFSSLPEELRIQIFEAAIYQSPRIIEICQEGIERKAASESEDSEDDESIEVSVNGEETKVTPDLGLDGSSENVISQTVELHEGAAKVADNHDAEGARELQNDQEIQEARTADQIQLTEEALKQLDLSSQTVATQEPSPAGEETANGTPGKAKEDSDSDSDSDSSSSAPSNPPSSEGEPIPPNTSAFYTSTPVHPLLHTSREARETALKHYQLSFPHYDHPPTIYYNPYIDILYFPSWAFPGDTSRFDDSLSPTVKASIRRVAIDNTMWFSSWEDGHINCTFQIDLFQNVEELLLVVRQPGRGCGCCMENSMEVGVVSFEDSKADKYYLRCENAVRAEFERIKERDPEWNVPGVVRSVFLLRAGNHM